MCLWEQDTNSVGEKTCPQCGTLCTEDLTERVFSVRQRIRVTDIEAQQQTCGGCFDKDIEVEVTDEMVNSVRLGQDVRMLVLLRCLRRPNSFPVTNLTVNNLFPGTVVIPLVPEAIHDWNAAGFSAWNVINRLVDNFAGSPTSFLLSFSR